MGYVKIKSCIRYGLFDNDLSNLSHHLKCCYDYVDAVVDVAKFICTRFINDSVGSARHVGKLICYCSNQKSSRVIIVHGFHKIVSFHFPFDIEKRGQGVLITLNGREINSKALEKVKEINNHLKKEENKRKWGEVLYTLVDVADDLGNDESDPIDPFHLSLYSKISTTEPGYLRYDYDPKAANGIIHPLHHLDINYDLNATYKCGLYGPLELAEFESMFISGNHKMFLHHYDKQREELVARLKKPGPKHRRKKRS